MEELRFGATIYVDDRALELAERCARGVYQRALLDGGQRWSGGDLRGRAARWSGAYARSRDALIRRLIAAGLTVRTEYRERGLRCLAIAVA